MRNVLFRLAVVATGFALILPIVGAVTASAQSGGVLSGLVTARFTGQPVPGACVAIFDDQQAEVAAGCADGTGHYELSVDQPDSYRVRATGDGYGATWYAQDSLSGDARDFASASSVYVWGAIALDVGLRPPGIGVLRGRITDLGEPVAGAVVFVQDMDFGRSSRPPTVTTGADGLYEFRDLWPGHWTLGMVTNGGYAQQFHHQKKAEADADLIVVAGDQDTVVDEELIPSGIVDLTVLDDSTGVPLTAFCGAVHGGTGYECTSNGRWRYPVTTGTYGLSVYPPQSHFPTTVFGVVVRPGEVTSMVSRVRPGMAVRSTVRDAVTGNPVVSTCVIAVAVDAPAIQDRDNSSSCTDGLGVLTIGPMEEETFRLFVRPAEPHGMQWVGRRGGTGDQEEALSLRPRLGIVTELPDIRLDRAGAVVGTLRSELTGQPARDVCVFPHATERAVLGQDCTDQDGRYRIDGLGPYRWPLLFADKSGIHGWRWSGNQPNRWTAKRVKVTSGRDATANERLPYAANVAGVAVVKNVGSAIVDVSPRDAYTGDYAGPPTVAAGVGRYWVSSLGSRDVRLLFTEVGGQGRTVWYLDAGSFVTATRIRLRAGERTDVLEQVIR